jgi:hemolysin activation/secretion protein
MAPRAMQNAAAALMDRRSCAHARPRRGSRGHCIASLVGAIALILNSAAFAQLVERNLPPEPPHRAPSIKLPGDAVARSDDAAPLGVNVHAIVLIGAGAVVKHHGKMTGVDVGQIESIDAPVVRERLAPFIGQPLSRKLLDEIQNAVMAVYREGGRPFVSVSVPPQELTAGVLQLRVIPFKLGQVKVEGTAPENFRRERIRAAPGEGIDAKRLETDLDWANRNPFRRVETVFGPGKDLATTDVTIQVTDRRPWQVYAGYANSGTRLTDRNRSSVGAVAAPIGDVIVAYQLTGSADLWGDSGRFMDVGMARYYSQAGRVLLPLGLRSSLELVADDVQTNERPADLFRIRTRTTQLAALVRTDASDLARPLFGDLIAGIELKNQQRQTFFDGIDVAQGQAAVAQAVIGWNGRWPDALGTNVLDIRVKSNPGGIVGSNTAGDWNLFSNGRVSDVRTTFSTAEYNRVTPMPLGLTLKTDVSALISAQPLPDTERIALGGAQGVRGYVTEDGVVDQALIMRNALLLPMPGAFSWLPGAIVPFVLGDVGWGRDVFAGRDQTLAAVGAGLDYTVGTYFTSSLTAAMALRDGLDTPAKAWRISLRATVTY